MCVMFKKKKCVFVCACVCVDQASMIKSLRTRPCVEVSIFDVASHRRSKRQAVRISAVETNLLLQEHPEDPLLGPVGEKIGPETHAFNQVSEPALPSPFTSFASLPFPSLRFPTLPCARSCSRRVCDHVCLCGRRSDGRRRAPLSC